VIKFCNNIIGSVYLDYMSQPTRNELTVIGRKGTIKWDNADWCAMIYMAGKKIPEVYSPLKAQDRNLLFLQEMEYFIRCIKEKKAPDCGMRAGLASLRLAMAIQRSQNEGREIRVL
jgi:predicted dehydrogenase